MPTDLVRLTVADGVATVELNRPERRNAITGPLLDALAEAVGTAGADPEVQAVVFCGAGGAFCSGLDLGEYNADPPPDWLATSARSLRAAHVALAMCPVPVVTALERFAINGGAALALAGDVVVVGRESWLQVGEVRIGMPAPNNLAWLLARHSPATALRVALVGDRIPGPKLLELTIAHEVVDDAEVRARAEELAAEIATAPAGSTRVMKEGALRIAGLDDPEAWFARAAEMGARPDGAFVRPSHM
jgi:enoyl-CoA hydratase/carnithine racemase